MSRAIKNPISFYVNLQKGTSSNTGSTNKPSSSSSSNTSKPTTNNTTTTPSIDKTDYNELKKLIDNLSTKVNSIKSCSCDISTLNKDINNLKNQISGIKSCSCDTTKLANDLKDLSDKVDLINSCTCETSSDTSNTPVLNISLLSVENVKTLVKQKNSILSEDQKTSSVKIDEYSLDTPYFNSSYYLNGFVLNTATNKKEAGQLEYIIKTKNGITFDNNVNAIRLIIPIGDDMEWETYNESGNTSADSEYNITSIFGNAKLKITK